MSERADRGVDLWTRAWLVLASDRVVLIWLGLLLLCTVIALSFPQVPRSVYTQERGLESWLTGVRARLGSPTDVLLALGFLRVERAPWFRAILGGIGVSLVLRAVDSLARLVAPGRRGPVPLLAQTIVLPVNVPASLNRIRTYLRGKSQVTTMDEEGYRLRSTRPLAALGSLLVSLGGLLLIAGWIWTQTAGWQASDLFVTDGIPAAVAEANGALTLEDFEVEWRDGATAEHARGRLHFASDQGDHSGEISLNAPWRWKRTTYDLTDVGPAVHVTGKGPGGKPLLLQVTASGPAAEELTLALPAGDNLRSFAAPEEGIVVQVEAATGEQSPEIHLRVYLGQAGELVEDRVTDTQAFVLIGGSRLSLTMIPFAQITATHTPGRPAGIGAVVLIVAGAILALVYPGREIEVVAESKEKGTVLTVAAGGRRKAQWLAALSEQLASDQRGDDEH